MHDENINRERYINDEDFGPSNEPYDVIEDVYGEDLDPKRSSKIIRSKVIKRKHVVAEPNQTSIKPGGTLCFKMPKLDKNDMIVPKSFFVSFNLDISGKKDVKRTVVANIGRKIVKKLLIKLGNNDIYSIDYYDELMTYLDFWLSKKEKAQRVFQGIQSEAGLKLRVDSDGAATTDNEEVAIGKTLGNRFRIPIDFELFNDTAPFSQYHLLERLQFEITFNDPKSVILGNTSVLASASDRDYDYVANDINLEYDVITDESLSQAVWKKYQELVLPITQYQHYEMITIPKTKTNVEIKIDKKSKRLSHILIIAKDSDNDRKDFARKDVFKNLDIKTVRIKTYGNDDMLYPRDLRKENTYDEALKLFDSNGVSIGEFLTTKYGLCLNFKPSTDAKTHGSGLALSSELQITIERISTGSGNLDLHVFLFRDGHLNIENGRFKKLHI